MTSLLCEAFLTNFPAGFMPLSAEAAAFMCDLFSVMHETNLLHDQTSRGWPLVRDKWYTANITRLKQTCTQAYHCIQFQTGHDMSSSYCIGPLQTIGVRLQTAAGPCTRTLYQPPSNTFITGRFLTIGPVLTTY